MFEKIMHKSYIWKQVYAWTKLCSKTYVMLGKNMMWKWRLKK